MCEGSYLRSTADLEQEMRKIFSVAEGAQCRVWHLRGSPYGETWLSDSSKTLEEANLNIQVHGYKKTM